jgi:hypothetical protein
LIGHSDGLGEVGQVIEHLDFLRKRLVRVKRDDVWGSDHEGPYIPGEKSAEIMRLKAEIAKEEAANA